jgi:hypothetical protein
MWSKAAAKTATNRRPDMRYVDATALDGDAYSPASLTADVNATPVVPCRKKNLASRNHWPGLLVPRKVSIATSSVVHQ